MDVNSLGGIKHHKLLHGRVQKDCDSVNVDEDELRLGDLDRLLLRKKKCQKPNVPFDQNKKIIL